MYTLNDSSNINLYESNLDITSFININDYEFKNMLDSTLNKTLSNIIELVPNRLKDLDYFNTEQERIFIHKVKRERQIHLIPKNDKKKKHTINSIDNMIRKVKIYFIKFLVNLTNDLRKNLKK